MKPSVSTGLVLQSEDGSFWLFVLLMKCATEVYTLKYVRNMTSQDTCY